MPGGRGSGGWALRVTAFKKGILAAAKHRAAQRILWRSCCSGMAAELSGLVIGAAQEQGCCASGSQGRGGGSTHAEGRRVECMSTSPSPLQTSRLPTQPYSRYCCCDRPPTCDRPCTQNSVARIGSCQPVGAVGIGLHRFNLQHEPSMLGGLLGGRKGGHTGWAGIGSPAAITECACGPGCQLSSDASIWLCNRYWAGPEQAQAGNCHLKQQWLGKQPCTVPSCSPCVRPQLNQS